MPHLNDIHQRWSSKGVQIIAVSREKDDAIARFIADERVIYPVARSSRASGLYGVSGIPDAMLIGKDGKVVWRDHPGYIDDAMLSSVVGGEAVAPGAGGSADSALGSFLPKLAIAVILGVLAVFVLLRTIRKNTVPPPHYAGYPPAYPQAPPRGYGPPQGAPPPPPANSANCPHCGSPKREGRKNCMGCGAPL